MLFTIHTDGGSRGNPGKAAIGVTISQDQVVIHEISKYIGVETNNIAEYTAVYEALLWTEQSSLPSPHSTISFLLDSLLVVEQLNGRYKMKNPELKIIWLKIQKLKSQLPYVITFTHVRREQNTRADFLVNKALDSLEV